MEEFSAKIRRFCRRIDSTCKGLCYLQRAIGCIVWLGTRSSQLKNQGRGDESHFEAGSGVWFRQSTALPPLHMITQWHFETKVLRTVAAKVRSFGWWHTVPPLTRFLHRFDWHRMHLGFHFHVTFAKSQVQKYPQPHVGCICYSD